MGILNRLDKNGKFVRHYSYRPKKKKARNKKQYKSLTSRLTQYEKKKTGFWIWKGGKKVIFLKKSFTKKLR